MSFPYDHDPDDDTRREAIDNRRALSRDTRRAHTWLAAALTVAVAAVCGALWWFDRVAEPSSPRPTIHQSWVAPFAEQDGRVAIREMPEDAGR